MLDRRRFLTAAALGAGSLFVAPHLALARVASDRRFLFVIQRGAADGLNIVVPHGDPDYSRLRGALAIDAGSAIKLNGQFALHPALAGVGKLYGEGQALFVHAVASPYRERSHFDGQNVLETGGARPYAVKDGWLNRLTGLLPKVHDEAIAFAPTVPLALRGRAEVSSYAASNLPQASDDLLARVQLLYARDPMLHGLWSAAMEARGLAGDSGPKQDPASLGKLAATFLSQADGPRIAMIETGGWDTHSGQNGRLAGQLKQLDAMLGAFREGLGPVWNDTVVLVATEFGRTAAANGTGGTDHGTGSAAMLIGGAVKGGRVLADWPGLGQNALLDGRDLRPTRDLDALIAGCTAETFGLDPALVARTLAQTGRTVRPMEGLVRV